MAEIRIEEIDLAKGEIQPHNIRFAQESAEDAMQYMRQNGIQDCVPYQNHPPVPERNSALGYFEFYVPFDLAFQQNAKKGANRVIVECQGAAPTGNWWYTNTHYKFFSKRQAGTRNAYQHNVSVVHYGA